jgi:4-hydroxybenzoate polyprenyltransferase
MKKLYHFIRLTRPVNLLVIALTMGVIQVYLSNDRFSSLYEINFLLLVFSTTLIGAAGNIINDYFDVKADRVNKPEQLIIDVHIKRRSAILWNWIFNSVGLLIALYLSWRLSNWWIVIISFGSVNILWFYSMYFKRTFLAGNIFVAFLTAIVPLYVFVFDPAYSVLESQLIWIFCGYAFLLNFIREIVKDMADIKGDLQLKSASLPIVLGIRKTMIILLVLYGVALMPLVFMMGSVLNVQLGPAFGSKGFEMEFLLLGLVILCISISWLTLPRAFYRSKYLLASNMLKLAMLFGLLIPLFL